MTEPQEGRPMISARAAARRPLLGRGLLIAGAILAAAGVVMAFIAPWSELASIRNQMRLRTATEEPLRFLAPGSASFDLPKGRIFVSYRNRHRTRRHSSHRLRRTRLRTHRDRRAGPTGRGRGRSHPAGQSPLESTGPILNRGPGRSRDHRTSRRVPDRTRTRRERSRHRRGGCVPGERQRRSETRAGLRTGARDHLRPGRRWFPGHDRGDHHLDGEANPLRGWNQPESSMTSRGR